MQDVSFTAYMQFLEISRPLYEDICKSGRCVPTYAQWLGVLAGSVAVDNCGRIMDADCGYDHAHVVGDNENKCDSGSSRVGLEFGVSDVGVGSAGDGSFDGVGNDSNVGLHPIVMSRNKMWREKKKARKQKRQAMNQDWRVRTASNSGASSPVEDGGQLKDRPSGFWNSCSEETRRQLIESKAKMHIAENERKTREANERVKKLESKTDEMRLMESLNQVLQTAQQIKKNSKDTQVIGWAETVVEATTKSVGSAVPPSIKTLSEYQESGSSGAQSPVDSNETLVEKVAEKDRELELLQDKIRQLEIVQSNQEKVNDINKAKNARAALQNKLDAELNAVETRHLLCDIYVPYHLDAEKEEIRRKPMYASLFKGRGKGKGNNY